MNLELFNKIVKLAKESSTDINLDLLQELGRYWHLLKTSEVFFDVLFKYNSDNAIEMSLTDLSHTASDIENPDTGSQPAST